MRTFAECPWWIHIWVRILVDEEDDDDCKSQHKTSFDQQKWKDVSKKVNYAVNKSNLNKRKDDDESDNKEACLGKRLRSYKISKSQGKEKEHEKIGSKAPVIQK